MLWTSKRPGFLCNCILWDYHNQFAEKKCSHRQEAFKNCCCPSLLRLVPKQRTPQHQFYSGAVVTHHIGKSLHPQPKSERSSNRAFCGPPGGSQQMNKWLWIGLDRMMSVHCTHLSLVFCLQRSLERMGMDASLAVERALSQSRGRSRDRKRNASDMEDEEMEDAPAIKKQRVHSTKSRWWMFWMCSQVLSVVSYCLVDVHGKCSICPFPVLCHIVCRMVEYCWRCVFCGTHSFGHFAAVQLWKMIHCIMWTPCLYIPPCIRNWFTGKCLSLLRLPSLALGLLSVTYKCSKSCLCFKNLICNRQLGMHKWSDSIAFMIHCISSVVVLKINQVACKLFAPECLLCNGERVYWIVTRYIFVEQWTSCCQTWQLILAISEP